jgi:hypothetical protein
MDEQIKKLKQKIGDLIMDIDILKEAAKRSKSTPPMATGDCGPCCAIG